MKVVTLGVHVVDVLVRPVERDPRGPGRTARRADPDHAGGPGRRDRGHAGQARRRAFAAPARSAPTSSATCCVELLQRHGVDTLPARPPRGRADLGQRAADPAGRLAAGLPRRRRQRHLLLRRRAVGRDRRRHAPAPRRARVHGRGGGGQDPLVRARARRRHLGRHPRARRAGGRDPRLDRAGVRAPRLPAAQRRAGARPDRRSTTSPPAAARCSSAASAAWRPPAAPTARWSSTRDWERACRPSRSTWSTPPAAATRSRPASCAALSLGRAPRRGRRARLRRGGARGPGARLRPRRVRPGRGRRTDQPARTRRSRMNRRARTGLHGDGSSPAALITGAAAAWPAAAEAAKRKAQARSTTGPSPSTRRRRRLTRPTWSWSARGFAGLTAARAIASAGHSVIVLEARDRVGGRAWNHDLGGGRVSERGAAFVGPTQDHILALANAVGVGTFPTYDDGDDLYVNNVEDPLGLIGPQRYSDSGPIGGLTGTAPPDPTIVAELTEVVQQLDQMSTQVPVDSPWSASSAATWDGQTLEQLDRREQRHAALQGAGPGRHAAHLRRRAARAVAPVRAVLHRRLGQRAEPGHVRAQLRHPQRRPAVAGSSAAPRRSPTGSPRSSAIAYR